MVDRDDVPLIEVLPARQYRDSHLPKAISIPLSDLSAPKVSQFKTDSPIIVYCYDYQ